MTPNPNPGLLAQSTLAPLASEFANDPDMRELIDLFVAEMPGKIASLESLWRERQLEPLKRLAHQLRGAGGGYGFSKVSHAAGRVEEALKMLLSGNGPEAELSEAQAGVEELLTLCRRVSVAVESSAT